MNVKLDYNNFSQETTSAGNCVVLFIVVCCKMCKLCFGYLHMFSENLFSASPLKLAALTIPEQEHWDILRSYGSGAQFELI